MLPEQTKLMWYGRGAVTGRISHTACHSSDAAWSHDRVDTALTRNTINSRREPVSVFADQSTPVRPVSSQSVIATLLGVVLGLILAAAFAGLSQVSHVDRSTIVSLGLDNTYDGATLTVGLSRPVAYAGVVGRRAVTFNIAVTNRDATPFSLASLGIQAASGSAQDAQITDPANNVGASSATVLPGRSLVWQIAFTVPAAADDITVQVSPVDGGRTVVFSGSL
jgi:hypothetical protein